MKEGPPSALQTGGVFKEGRSDTETKEPAPEATAQVMERARDNGLLIGKGGLFGNVLRLSPMLNISKSDVDEGVRLLDKAFSEVRN